MSALAPGKAEFVRGLGADEVIAYDSEDWGEPVDYVLDAVGGDLLTPAVAALAPGGRLVAYSSGGGSVRTYDLLVGAKSVIGFQMARIARNEPGRYERWREELWRLFAEGPAARRARGVRPGGRGEGARGDRVTEQPREGGAAPLTDEFRFGVNTTCARFLWGRWGPK